VVVSETGGMVDDCHRYRFDSVGWRVLAGVTSKLAGQAEFRFAVSG
jgi:hypothetical protein